MALHFLQHFPFYAIFFWCYSRHFCSDTLPGILQENMHGKHPGFDDYIGASIGMRSSILK